MIPLEGVDRFLDMGSLPMRFVPGLAVWFAGEGAVHKFVSYDGVVQRQIKVDADIDVLGFGVSPGGVISFLGVRLSTNAKTLGTVPAGAEEVTIISEEGIDAENVVAFTQIN